MEEKRIRSRAIIIKEGKLVTMYRERQGRIFYTFPGGGMEENETEKECVKREVLEEFGIIINPIKKVYTYENKNSIEHFFLAEWIDGVFGSGQGEEFQENRNNGVYIPKLIEISDIPKIPLMPPEVASAFYNDYTKNGKNLRNNVKFVLGEIK